MRRPSQAAREDEAGAVRVEVRAPSPGGGSRDRLSSVARALDVLEAIAAAPSPLPAKAVARHLGISLGRSYHILNTLEDAGYVVRLAHGRFGLGPKVPGLYRLFHARLDLVPTPRDAGGTVSVCVAVLALCADAVFRALSAAFG